MNLRYPIGQFKFEAPLTDDERQACMLKIEETPASMRAAVAGLNEEQLDTPYRPAGWNVRQVVHHVPDSHMNGYTRMKLAMTEDSPTLKLYHEALWAELPEARTAPVDVSLDLLDALHFRWTAFLRALTHVDFQRPYIHPDLGLVPIDVAIGIYAWHGKHHTAHITSALRRPA